MKLAGRNKPMANIAGFDQEIENTKQAVEEMRGKLEQSGVVLESLAEADKTIGE